MNYILKTTVLGMILGLSLGTFSTPVHADPVTWMLRNVTFDDGGTATGTFVFDAATQTASDINIQTTAGTVFSGNTYTTHLGAQSVKIPFTTGTDFEDLTNEFILDLLFIGDGLTDSGGTVAIGETGNGSSVESFCVDALCNTQVPQRFINPGGSVIAAELIDFESFQVGDSLAEVNSVTSAQGATFVVGPLCLAGGPFLVVTDPNDPNNQVIESCTNPAESDIVVNFSFPVDLVRVTFTANPEPGNNGISVDACSSTGTATSNCDAIDFAGGVEPNTLEVAGPGIRSVILESGSGRIFIDDIEFIIAAVNVPADDCADPGGCDLGGQILELPPGVATEGVTITRESTMEPTPGDDGVNTIVLADGRLFVPPFMRSSSPIQILEMDSNLIVTDGTIQVTIEPGDFLDDPLPCDAPIPVGVDPQQQDIVVWQTTDAADIMEGRALEITSDCGGSSRGRSRGLSFFVVGLRLDCGVDWFVDPRASKKVRRCFKDLTHTKFDGLIQAVIRAKNVLPRKKFRKLLALAVVGNIALHWRHYNYAEKSMTRLIKSLEKITFETSDFNNSGNIEMRAYNVRFMLQKIQNIIRNEG